MAKKTHILFSLNRTVVALVLVGSLAGTVTGRATAGLLDDLGEWFGGDSEFTTNVEPQDVQQDDMRVTQTTGGIWDLFSWFEDAEPVMTLTPTVEEPAREPFADCTVTRSDTGEELRSGGVVSFHEEVTFILSSCGDGDVTIDNEELAGEKNSAVATDDGMIFVRGANDRVTARAPEEDIDEILVVGGMSILVSATSSGEPQTEEAAVEPAVEPAMTAAAPEEVVDLPATPQQVAVQDVDDLPWMKGRVMENIVQTAIQDVPHAAAPAFDFPKPDKYCKNPTAYPDITWYNCPVTTMGFVSTDPDNMPYGLVPAGSVSLEYDYPWMRETQPVIYTNDAGQQVTAQPTTNPGTTTTTTTVQQGTVPGATPTLGQPILLGQPLPPTTGVQPGTTLLPAGGTSTDIVPTVGPPPVTPPPTIVPTGTTLLPPVGTSKNGDGQNFVSTSSCNNGGDDDEDGLVDRDDPGCVSWPNTPMDDESKANPRPAASHMCDNGHDDDGDSLTDMDDPGCMGYPGDYQADERRAMPQRRSNTQSVQ